MLNSGDVFAGFTIERLLGQGGMGSVYLARHPRLGKLTALKLLNRELYADREIRARFEREADLVARLDHPNIVEVYDRGTENDMLWISMQYVDGVDAASVNVATLPPERAVQVIEGVASALDYAHGMGVLHRDVKPANIILARAVAGHGERVFLTDFGIARLREDSTHLTQAGMFTATLAYASPEQMTGAPLDPTTDQYSLACALYWLLIGAGPFDSPHPAELIRGHLQLLPPPVSLRRPGLSPAMDAVLTKAMAKRPADRFPTCTAFAKAARQALAGPKAPHPVHQQAAYPNPPAPQANYPAAQPYPAPGYPAPPQGYPAAPQQQPLAYPAPPNPQAQPAPQPIPAAPPNYPAPQPQPGAPGYPVPNYLAPQPQPGAPTPQHPIAAPGYPASQNPQQPGGPSGFAAPAQPAAGAPPQSPPDTERVNSGPTARPGPPVPEPAPADYPAPQPQSAPLAPPGQAGSELEQVGTRPSNRPQAAAGAPPRLPPPASVGAPGPRPLEPEDPAQRPTDVVPQPVVVAGRQDDSGEQRTEVMAQPGAPTGTGRADAPEQASIGPVGSPGFEELIAEPVTALSQPMAGTAAEAGAAAVPMAPMTTGVAGRDSGVGAKSVGSESESVDGDPAGSMGAARPAPAESTATSEPTGTVEPAKASAPVDSAGTEVASGDLSRHPDSGAFVPETGADAPTAVGVPDLGEPESSSATGAESAAASEMYGPAAGGWAAPVGNAEAAVPGGEAGYAGYPGGPGYPAAQGQSVPNQVRPGLVPTSQRAEASQVTALVVLGLAVVALLLMVVVAVVLVS
ncbi:serine/threonine-protein kinase, partial [Nocardia seriolae]